MGNTKSKRGSQMGTISGISSDDNASSSSNKGMSRTPSGADIQETRSSTQLMPIEKLAKILLQKSNTEESVHGITAGAFARCVFPRYLDFGEKVFHHMHSQVKTKVVHLTSSQFKQQCEKYLAVLDDDIIREIYVRMFAERVVGENGVGDMSRDNLHELLMTCYRLAMDHYCDGPQTCILEDEKIERTLSSVINSCYHNKKSLSSQFVTHWLGAHCPRLLLPLHRYCVHAITTAYRQLERDSDDAVGLELSTPVLEQGPPFSQSANNKPTKNERLMPVSEAWLLASALPPIYSLPQTLPTPNGSNSNFTSYSFLSKLISAVPSHWMLLYDSDEHGLGANRFLHHVLAYRGPTLILFRAECGNVFCVAASCEWRETHLYWGDQNCVVLQLLPNFAMIQRGPKLLYLNTNIRGYPQGLRAGTDPREPILIVDASFEKITFKSVPYNLLGIEVWGCGDTTSREKQLDIKKWQVKEAERQRQVKLSAADWLDHPDRYLLEMAGRPNYNNSKGQ